MFISGGNFEYYTENHDGWKDTPNKNNNRNRQGKGNVVETPGLPYIAKSVFSQQLDIIIKRHLANMMDARDSSSIESDTRAKLDSYIRNVKIFVNTWAQSFLVPAMFNQEQLKDLWLRITEKDDYVISFLLRILNELKMLYTAEGFIELVDNVASSFTVYINTPNYNETIMNSETASKFITKDELKAILLRDQWLISFLGITLMDFIHD